MKFLIELAVILSFSLLGEMLRYFLPLPVPSGIYGMLLLFLALSFRILRLEQIAGAGKFLLETMPVMFIPSGVAIITVFSTLKPYLAAYLVIIFSTTIAVLVATGKTAEYIISQRKNK